MRNLSYEAGCVVRIGRLIGALLDLYTLGAAVLVGFLAVVIFYHSATNPTGDMTLHLAWWRHRAGAFVGLIGTSGPCSQPTTRPVTNVRNSHELANVVVLS